VNAAWSLPSPRPASNKRAAERINLMLPARLTWKDQRGTERFASVITRDVSEFGVFVECSSPISIKRHRLVQFQLERNTIEVAGVPESLRQGRLLSAVYRVHPASRSGARQGLALRLMVAPRRRVQAELPQDDTRAGAAPAARVAETRLELVTAGAPARGCISE